MWPLLTLYLLMGEKKTINKGGPRCDNKGRNRLVKRIMNVYRTGNREECQRKRREVTEKR